MSSQPPPSPRGCREDDTWAPSCSLIDADVKRIDEIQRFATNVLALHPEAGEQITPDDDPDADNDEGDVWGFVTAPWPNAPSVVIYYRFDEEYVYLIKMELADETVDEFDEDDDDDGGLGIEDGEDGEDGEDDGSD